MENFSYHVPFYVVNGGVATSGHSSDLPAGQVGLFDRANFNVATNVGNGTEFFFAQGNIGGKDWFGGSVSETHKSPFFRGKDVENMYLSLPQKIQNEEWVIGYNGAQSSIGLKFEEGKAFKLQFYFHGQPTYRYYAGPKTYVVSYTPDPSCVAPCAEGDCPDPIVDSLEHTQKVIDLINNHTELRKFGVRAKIVASSFAAVTPNMEKYKLCVCDNGDSVSLNAVKAQFPGKDIKRISRSGSTSCYEFCQKDSLSAPADFAQSGSVLQAVCNDCPDGSFLIPAKDVYIVKRPIVGGEDFTTAVTRDTYANTIWTAYASAASVTTTTSTTSTTTAAGTANADATFVGQDGGVAIVKLKFEAGASISRLGSDIVEFSHSEAAQCVFDTPASIAWELSGTGISSTRTLKLSGINRPVCDQDGDRLEDITATLAGVKGIKINTLTLVEGDGCVDDYTVQQDSEDCLDEDCLTNNVSFTYDTLPAFENRSWVVVPETIVEDATRKTGIRVTAGYVDPKFGDASFTPYDYYESMPVKMEVSMLTESGSACDYATLPTVHQSKVGQIARQSGEYIVREVIMKTDAYLKHMQQFSMDTRMREAFDQNLLSMVDRKAFYNLYYVTFKASYGASFRKGEQEKFTAVFAFKEGDPAAQKFESQVVDVLTAKSGIKMHVNS